MIEVLGTIPATSRRRGQRLLPQPGVIQGEEPRRMESRTISRGSLFSRTSGDLWLAHEFPRADGVPPDFRPAASIRVSFAKISYNCIKVLDIAKSEAMTAGNGCMKLQSTD